MKAYRPKHKRLQIILSVATLALLAAWFMINRSANDTRATEVSTAPPLESTNEDEGTQRYDSPADRDTVADPSPREPAAQASAEPPHTAGQTSAIPLDDDPLLITFETTELEEDLALYHERFPAARIIELVHFEPIGERIPEIDPSRNIHAMKLPLPGRDPLLAEIVQHVQRSPSAPSRGTFIANAAEYGYSEIIVSYFDEAMSASIIISEYGHFEIAYAGNGNHLLIEIDPDRIEPCGGAIIPDLAMAQEQEDTP